MNCLITVSVALLAAGSVQFSVSAFDTENRFAGMISTAGNEPGSADSHHGISQCGQEPHGFTLDGHRFTIVQGTPYGVNHIIIAEYLGSTPLYKAPEMMNYDGVTYTVVGISDGAYAGNTALVSVNLSPQIAEVGKDAFENCTSLRAISFGKALASIGSRAFAGCSKLSSVIFTSETVPDVAEDAFEGIADPCMGKCPEGREDEYAASKGLAPIDFKTSGAGGIYAGGEGTVEIYTLDGVRVSNPAKGEPVIISRVSPDGKVTVTRRIAK